MKRLQRATTQSLLQERRFNVQEKRRERCQLAQTMLAQHVAMIDLELARRRAR